MSDKTVLADNSMSDNATAVERRCLTDYRVLDECPTKQQVGNSVYKECWRDELERALGVRSVGEFGDSGPDSDALLPYSINVCEAVELAFEVFAASPLTQNNERRGNENK